LKQIVTKALQASQKSAHEKLHEIPVYLRFFASSGSLHCLHCLQGGCNVASGLGVRLGGRPLVTIIKMLCYTEQLLMSGLLLVSGSVQLMWLHIFGHGWM
jgi:hypothetical protein